MTADSTWNDTARSDLRETLRNLIVGEVRLAKYGHDDIIHSCRVVYIENECPEDEWDSFVRFASDELEKAEEITKRNKKLTLTMCVNYGGRAEIAYAVAKIAADVKSRKLDPAKISERTIGKYLDEPGMPDVEIGRAHV